MTTQEIIQNHILGEIFSEFPTDLDTNAFDFFLRADVNCAEDVASSPLGEEWGFEVCEQYSLENIRNLRGLMQSMYSDLERLKSALFQQATSVFHLNKEDIVDENIFYGISESTNIGVRNYGNGEEFLKIVAFKEDF